MKKGTGHIRELLYLLRVIPDCSTARRLNLRGRFLNRCSFVQVKFTEKQIDYYYLFIPGLTEENFIKFIIRSSNVCNYS